MSLTWYYRESAKPFYGAITALIMLLFYEIFLIWDLGGSQLRNAPEAWTRNFFFTLGFDSRTITFGFITFAFTAIIVSYRSTLNFNAKLIPMMLIEATVLGVSSGFIIQAILVELFFNAAGGGLSGSFIRDLGLAIGAGLFEELFFRVILTSLLIMMLIMIVKIKPLAVFLAVILASLLFSGSHYIGNAADQFTLYSFSFRFIAGLWFTTLYSLRGFAITALTHAFYDIFVLFVI